MLQIQRLYIHCLFLKSWFEFLQYNQRNCQFFSQQLSVHGWTSAFFLGTNKLCGAIGGDSTIFCHAGSRWVDRVLLSREKSFNMLRRMAGNWTRTTKRTGSENHSFSNWAILTHLPDIAGTQNKKLNLSLLITVITIRQFNKNYK